MTDRMPTATAGAAAAPPRLPFIVADKVCKSVGAHKVL